MSDRTPTVQQLLNALKKLEKWLTFGVLLGVPLSQLRKIELNHQKDSNRCKLELLQYWLDSTLDPTWNEIVQALEETDQLALAAQIKHDYLWSTVVSEEEDVAKPDHEYLLTSSATTLDKIEVKIEADRAVVRDLKVLEYSFGLMLVEVKRLLDHNNCDLSIGLFFLDSVIDSEDFIGCDNFEKLVRQLQQGHIDVFNVSILQQLVDRFDNPELTKVIDEYNEKKESFLKSTSVLEFQRAVVSRVGPVPVSRMTIVISEEMASRRTLKDIQKIAEGAFEEHHEKFFHRMNSYRALSEGGSSVKQAFVDGARPDPEYFYAHATNEIKGHIAAYHRMIKEKQSLKLHTLHVILHGLPAVGKTCAKLRLTGQTLSGRKRAELGSNHTLVYLPDDGACSTPVAEEVIRARLPSTVTALTGEADDQPWYLLQSQNEEIVGIVEKISKLSDFEDFEDFDFETKREEKHITATSSVPSSSPSTSLPADPVGKVHDEMIILAFKAPHNKLQNIFDETLIYLIDSGGQPQFQELLPILVSGPSVFLLTFSLAIPLDDVFEVIFTDEDGERDICKTNMRVRDVLMQSLASIRCTCSYQTYGEEKVEVKPRVIFMATMCNLVKEETIASINKQLECLVKPFSNLIVTNGSRWFFPVDSFENQGFSTLRKAVRCVANEKSTKVSIDGKSFKSPMCEVKLPIAAVALELLLRNQEKSVIPLDQCKRLAISCNIDPETELSHILWILHHFIGTIRYYPTCTSQQNVVIGPQKLYDVPSTLLTDTFAFEKEVELNRTSKEMVWNRGVFTMGTLRKLWGQDRDFTPELIVAFLTHLNIIVQMPHGDDSKEELFFMPSALVGASNEDTKEVSPDSALICFNIGYPPKGVFSSVIAYLPKPREGNEPVNLKWCLSTTERLCCNQATLVVSVDKEDEKFKLLVTFTLHLNFIEIAVQHAKDNLPQLQLGCGAVLSDITHAVQAVSQSLHYNSHATLKDGLFFPCYCPNEPSTHAGKYCHRIKEGECHNWSSNPGLQWMQKWIKGTGLEVKHSQPNALPQDALGRQRGVSDNMVGDIHTAACTHLPTTASDDFFRALTIDDLNEVLDAIDDLNCWMNLGLKLRLRYHILERIEEQEREIISQCKMKMMAKWLRQQDVSQKGLPSWGVLRDALKQMGEHALAERISNRRCSSLAQSCSN